MFLMLDFRGVYVRKAARKEIRPARKLKAKNPEAKQSEKGKLASKSGYQEGEHELKALQRRSHSRMQVLVIET
jgi:hypothetical protein